jgi:hypothetical protein
VIAASRSLKPPREIADQSGEIGGEGPAGQQQGASADSSSTIGREESMVED